ncbi:tetratricopeptide repeat protein [Janthinobacterium sp. 17J80-10]|uniref:nuclear transport factor 2 family protein n=1 Tax=Janthinobacterium sp. 17J80-10 TaxID=2497863 RepID=UPI00100536E5|nr:tetratricopeptide repeat protein [Janthinobacterium sp. 17J80-10]QAU35267.1 tetratricopeptide repeat protein [Janthinobacterium sp. 17J80-10]
MYRKTLLVGGMLAALVAPPVFADEAADVGKLMRGGQFAEALSKADAFLAQRPKDAQMRFLKGVILTEQNKTAEAIAIFAKLTEDFPDLPEPYNNLAVLYASSGQFDKARAALDMAIRTNPSYATAYENLGDVHARLASQAYDKALQLDSGNTAAKSKLTLLRTLAVGNTKPAPAPAKVAVAPTPAPAVAPAKPVEKPETKIAAVEKPQVKPAAKPEPVAKAEPVRDDERDDVLKVVNAWAKAWSSQDVKTYLSYYSNDFQAPGGQSRAAWADGRRARIVGKGEIDVKVESPHITVEGNTATAKFRQIYVSDKLTANSRKTLIFTKQGNKWQIRQERAGS